MSRGKSRGAALEAGLFLLLLSPSAHGVPQDASLGFQWKATYAEGLDAALRRARPFIVYLPSVRADDEPSVIHKLPQLVGSPPLVEGVRAGADEVLGFMARFKVKKLPALVLLDRRENVIAGWEGGLPSDLWAKLQTAVRRVEKRDEDDAKLLADARRAASQGQLEAAYRKAQPLLESPRAAPENVEGARKIERDLLASLRAAAMRVLAGEGLRPDESLRKGLEVLRSSTSHAGFQAEIVREIAKLKSSTIGAR